MIWAMTEYGVAAFIEDKALMRLPQIDPLLAVKDKLDYALRRAGTVGDHRYEVERTILPPAHYSDDFPWCPYATFAQDRPGADLDEYPECGYVEHWGSGTVTGYSVYAFGDVP